MNRRHSGLALAAALAIAPTSACAYHPPHAAIRIGMNSVAADVLYGAAASAILPGAVPLPPPPPVQPSGAVTRVPSTPTAAGSPPATIVNACPPSRSTRVAHPTINRVVSAPVAATYPFRSTQRIQSATRSQRLNNIAETRQVSDIATRGSTITFAVTATYPFIGIVEKTDYQIVTSSNAPSEAEGYVPAGTLSGVYIAGQSVGSIGGPATSEVTWNPPIQILKLPAGVGETWAVSSSDQKTGQSETYTAKIAAVAQVNACGALVQGYQVTMSGQLISPGQPFPLAFAETDLIAPQFGALVLADNATVTARSSPTATTTQQLADTINVTPKLPAGSGS